MFTVVTTIGYGAFAPTTHRGKQGLVLYGAFGILMHNLCFGVYNDILDGAVERSCRQLLLRAEPHFGVRSWMGRLSSEAKLLCLKLVVSTVCLKTRTHSRIRAQWSSPCPAKVICPPEGRVAMRPDTHRVPFASQFVCVSQALLLGWVALMAAFGGWYGDTEFFLAYYGAFQAVSTIGFGDVYCGARAAIGPVFAPRRFSSSAHPRARSLSP